MLKISISGKRYRIPTHWEEVTLTQCAWLHHKINEQPVAIVDYYRSFATNSEPTPVNDTESLARLASETIGYLCGVPANLMLQTRRSDILGIALSILPRFALGVLGTVDYQPKGITSFWHRGHRYYLPETGTDISGTPTPLNSVSAIEFCQLSDIIASGVIELAPLAIASVCRRNGEHYNERVMQERAAAFGDLPASIYWELWSLASTAHAYLKDAFPKCYGTASEADESTEAAVWCDTLVAMAGDKPSELGCLQKMNAYDFVHLLSEGIKRRTEEWKMKAALASFGAM